MGLCNSAADTDRAGEANGVDAGMVDRRLANHPARAHHEVEDASRNAGSENDLGQRSGAAQHQLCRFEDNAVAKGQRRCNLPGWNRDREIPGCDQTDHTDGFAGNFHTGAGSH